MKSIWYCTAIMLGLLVACSSASAQSDQIIGSNRGTPTRGAIQSMSADEIVIKTTGVSRTFQVNEIAKVTYADDPGELRTARDRIMAGRLENALTLLEEISLGDNARNVVKQDRDYYIGYCKAKLALTGSGDKKAAARALQDFVKDPGKKSYHYYEANEILGDLAMGLGLFDTAVGFYGKVGEAAWPEYKLRASVKSAKADMLSQKFGEALKRFQSVIDSSATGEDAIHEKQLARAGLAHCLAETGKAEDGLKIVQTLIDNNDPKNVALFARAYNAMGACYRATGKPKDAILAYLHTDILFYGDADAHAESLYHLSKLWAEVKKSTRSVSARSLLQTRYGGSYWAQK